MRGAPFGLRPCKVRNLSRLDVVGNDPCVVPPDSNVTFLPLLSGSGREATAVKIPLDGILRGSSRNS